VCRRCGLEEITSWGRRPDGEVTEVVAWVAPTGRVLATRPVRSQQLPPSPDPLPVLVERVPESPSADALIHCPGTPEAWES
jgi:hypothetical protein